MRVRFRLHTDQAPLSGIRVTLGSKSAIGRTELVAVDTNRHGYGIISVPEKSMATDNISLQIGSQTIPLNPREADSSSVMAIHLKEADLPKRPQVPALPLSWHNEPLDIEDLDVIPGVFPDLGEGVFGEGFCERLLPTDQAPLIQELTHLVKTSRNVQKCEEGLTLDEGRLLHYQARWDFLGYSLGNLLKSVSLLPCEKVSIAVREWQHSIQQAAEEAQSEEQAQTTALAQSTSLSEVMDATIKSFEAGADMTAEVSGKLSSLFDLKLGISRAASYSHDAYNANMQRTLNHRIENAARASRYTQRVSLVEVSEQHSQRDALRTICNNNHCHTLNVFYRAVLENYRLSTRSMGWRDVIFVPYSVTEFTAESALCAQHLLADNLLAPQLVDCFEALARQTHAPVDDSDPNVGDDAGESTTNQFRISLTIGRNGLSKNRPVKLSLQMADGQTLDFAVYRSNRWKKEASYTHTVNTSSINPADIQKIGLKNDSSFRVDISSISFAFLDSNGWTTIASGSFGKLKAGSEKYLNSTYQAPTANEEPDGSLIGSNAAEERDRQDAICAARLLAHLNCNKHFYNQILWLGEDINERVCRFEKIACGDTVLADLVEPQPVGVFGCSVAFPKAGSSYVSDPSDSPDESLITLGTPCVYADAALGRCTTCETKDEDVYWDWSESPCNCGNTLTGPGQVNNAGLPTTPPFQNNGQLSDLIQGLKDLGLGIGSSSLGSLLETLFKTNTSLLKELLAERPDLTGEPSDSQPEEPGDSDG